MTTKTILKLAAAAVAVATAGAASATTMTITYKAGSSTLQNASISLNSGGNWNTVGAGRLAFDVNAKDPLDAVNSVIYTFCIEPTQYITPAPTAVQYQVDSLANGNTTLAPASLGATKAALISQLFARNFPTITSTMSVNQAAALQFAIWEVVAETSGVYNVTTGVARFKVTDTAQEAAVTSLANGYLSALTVGGPTVNGLFSLDNNGAQDQVSQFNVTTPSRFDASPVPEPATLGLFGLGALGLGLRTRRRKAA